MGQRQTRPLREALAQAFPDRPFSLAFWDGTRLAATDDHSLTFTVRSPRALAHVLRAPGQLGLGRSYVDGSLAVDDLDAALRLVATWSPPPVGRATALQRPTRQRSGQAAKRLGLGSDPNELDKLADSRLPQLVAALVRTELGNDDDAIRKAARG